MATSKKSSTSKTARVMNLLSKNREEPVEAEVAVAEEPKAQVSTEAPAPAVEAEKPAAPAAAPVAAPPAPAPHPTTPPLISSMQVDSAISNQVLSALENALEEELRDTQGAEPVPEPADTAVPEAAAEEPAPIEEPVIIEEPAPVEEPAAPPAIDAVAEAIAQITEAEEAVVEAAESSVIQIVDNVKTPDTTAKEQTDDTPHPPTRFPVDPATIYVNVMESLVEDKAMKYIQMFGLCQCHRCIADVKALALNRLDPKYVVMQNGEVIPRISFYEGKYSAAVTAQLLTACKIVMEHPRHERT